MHRPCPAIRFLTTACVTVVLAACGGKVPAPHDPSHSVDTAGNGNTGAASAHSDTTSPGEFQMGIQTEPLGETNDGRQIDRYILQNANGLKVSVINFGAVVMSVEVPDRDGNFENITLGFRDLEEYETNAPYFGAICGRYANRIAGGKFTLGGVDYTLATNNGPNHLHGGIKGFHQAVWNAETLPQEENSVGVSLTYVSGDGEEGYPGMLTTTVVYSLSNDDTLTIQYTAHAGDKATPVNLTSHCYWNLGGAGAGDVLDHQLLLNCDRYLPVDETLIPTGELKDVTDTPMDFTAQPDGTAPTIGSRIAEVKGGYDHCFVINGGGEKLTFAARIHDPKSGRVMEIHTTEPALQFYTGNFLDGSDASGGFGKHHGFCLECQHFPDSPNHPDFPSTILQPRQVYRQTTIHRFWVEN